MPPSRTATLLIFAAFACAFAPAQGTTPQPLPPTGKVIFERSLPNPDDLPEPDTTQPASTTQSSSSIETPTPPPTGPQAPPDKLPATPVTDAERSAIVIASYDLDVHLIPASAAIETHATIIVRNVTAKPLSRIALQLSSTLRWQSFTLRAESGLQRAVFTQSPIATDTDHTGYAQEAVVTLPTPLAPGATLTLTTFYTGDIQQSAARLELIGTPPGIAAETDWDQISAADTEAPTALRGFGDVLWFPCAEPIALLGDGNRLFEVVGRSKLKNSAASIRLRLTVEYLGEPPAVAIFNGHIQPLDHTPDTDDQLIAATHGIASATFAAQPLGFRVPSLFLTTQPPATAANQLVSTVTQSPDAAEPYASAAKLTQPLVSQWLGPTPLTPLLILDHPGQTFEDDALLVTPLQSRAASGTLAPMLVHGLTHAWFHSSHAWIDEGLAQFMNLLWTEQTRGRPDALLELEHNSNLIALAEPDFSQPGIRPTGQPLIAASSEVYFRAKAAAVWWQLRDILGDNLLQQSLQAYRKSATLNPAFDRDPKAMQQTIERVSQRNLSWFFDDWVDRDSGLPDLTIVAVATHPLPAREGKSAGYLVAVEVRNDGDAIAEVPVTIRSGELSASERLRIPAHSAASTRIPFESTPQTVQVNDGSVPELRSTLHTRSIHPL